MSDAASGSAAGDRKHRIERVLRDCLHRRHAGEALTDEQVIAAHPQLMPELAKGLHKLRVVSDARNRVENAPTQRHANTTAPPPPSGADEWSTIPAGLVIPGYALVRKISQGGQAFVYQAVQESTGRKVAVKVMREGPMASPRERARFEREVQILATIEHPGIVEVLDRGVAGDGSYFLVMDYILGQSLDAYLDEHRRQHGGDADPGELLRLFLKICDAVNAAHLRGIVHRDLKPSNIRIDPDGEPHVLDFGLARTAVSSMTDETNPQPVTITGQFVGSLPWASPEQADGIASRIDTRSDVYSLGVVLYQMLTGQFPYEVVGTMRDVLNNILHAEPTPPTKVLAAREAKELEKGKRRRKRHGVQINSEIEAVVLKALCKAREGRYQTAGDLARDLTNYLSGRPTEAGGAAGRRRTFAFALPRPSRNVIAVGAAAAIVLTVTTVALLFPRDRAVVGQRPLASDTERTVTNTSPGASAQPRAVASAVPPTAPAADRVKPAAAVAVAAQQAAPAPAPTPSPLKLEERTIDLGNGAKMEFVLIPAGSFTMGNKHVAAGNPLHKVNISKPFWLGKYEVTQAQWLALMGEDRSELKGLQNPVTNIDFIDIAAFLRRLNARDASLRARLPTEAEWEYACRAGTTTAWSWGDDPWEADPYAWYDKNNGRKFNHPVGQKKPNPWGLYDMHGNVGEAVLDWGREFTEAEVTDPIGKTDGEWGMGRGGNAGADVGILASGQRGWGVRSHRSPHGGFRVLLEVGAAAPAENGPSQRAAASASPTAAASPATPKKLPERTIDLGKGVKMGFVLIPAGSFMMGYPSQAEGNPVHRVHITKPFWMGKYEVTHAQWMALMDDRRIQTRGQLPVEHVQWIDVQAYLRRLNARDPSLKARLPTEAEWEYACRAGGTSKFYYGDDPWVLEEYSWHDRNAGGKAHPVGQKKPNAWGLYDMHGNVWEMCADWAGPYPEGEVTDPTGSAEGTTRAARGGGWNDAESVGNCGYRGGLIPGTNNGGFRLALEARPAAPAGERDPGETAAAAAAAAQPRKGAP